MPPHGLVSQFCRDLSRSYIKVAYAFRTGRAKCHGHLGVREVSIPGPKFQSRCDTTHHKACLASRQNPNPLCQGLVRDPRLHTGGQRGDAEFPAKTQDQVGHLGCCNVDEPRRSQARQVMLGSKPSAGCVRQPEKKLEKLAGTVITSAHAHGPMARPKAQYGTLLHPLDLVAPPRHAAKPHLSKE